MFFSIRVTFFLEKPRQINTYSVCDPDDPCDPDTFLSYPEKFYSHFLNKTIIQGALSKTFFFYSFKKHAGHAGHAGHWRSNAVFMRVTFCFYAGHFSIYAGHFFWAIHVAE